MIKTVADEMNFHKKEVQVLKSEKDTLESVLSMKTQDVKKTLTNELMRIDEEMKRHFQHQKAENARLQQQITALKGEKTALQQQLLGNIWLVKERINSLLSVRSSKKNFRTRNASRKRRAKLKTIEMYLNIAYLVEKFDCLRFIHHITWL